jgi:hypothetical protein
MVYGGKMAGKQSKDSFSERETARHLGAILQGAFAGPPTPLKDIPTRHGKTRKLERKKLQRRRRQRKKRAA